MNGMDLTTAEIRKFAACMDFGFYRVDRGGVFLECDPRARGIFDIPLSSDLSQYSIADFYAIPAEREERIETLLSEERKYLIETIPANIGNQSIMLFDICWIDRDYQKQDDFAGMIAVLKTNTISPKMFQTFPRGLYEVDENGKIVRANKKLANIMSFEKNSQLIGKTFRYFCKEEEKWIKFEENVRNKGSYREILDIIDGTGKILKLEFFSQKIEEFGKSRWGMVTDVTKRERYFEALDRMPTGYFHIESEKIVFCNKHFAKIMGFNNVENALHKDTRQYFLYESEIKKYFDALIEADTNGCPLQNYEIKIRKADGSGNITVSVDSQFIKDSKGNIVGREGTIRDISKEVELRDKVITAENNLKKISRDINNLIHTFLHPVIKYGGNSKLMYKISNLLREIAQKGSRIINGEENSVKVTGSELMRRLIQVRDKIKVDSNITVDSDLGSGYLARTKHNLISSMDLKEKFTEIINIFDYSLNSPESEILLAGDIREVALWTLEELKKAGYFDNRDFHRYIDKDFPDFLQGILFGFLSQGSQILISETQIMEREVEALRNFVGLERKNVVTFEKHDLARIIEEDLQLFKPVFNEDEIGIQYKKTGTLTAQISKNDIDRVICNLLHNARKYSYGGKGRFVKVTVRERQPANQVEFSIISFGVPIKKSEISDGSIWEFGYRGELVYNTDRDGTGVGLADAKNVIETIHGGEITLTSTPVANDGDPPQYKVPYITKITVRIPRKRGVNKGRC